MKKCESFPKKLIIGKVKFTDTKTIAETFNNFFVRIWPNLSLKILESDTNFEAYMSKANTRLREMVLTEDAFLEAFKSMEISETSSFDEIHQIYNHIKKPLIRTFGDSTKLGVFPIK